MSDILTPRDAMALVPELQNSTFRIEPLCGGLTNRVFKLSADDATYVLRLEDIHTDAFGLDRHTEGRALANAARAGIAPQIVHSNTDEGILLLRFIEGRVWDVDDFSDAESLEQLADLLRRVHALPALEKAFDAASIGAGYVNNLRSYPELRKFGQRCLSIIDDIGPAENCRCCHNDIVASNVIACPDLMLLDWEYACDNEPLFDLASVIAYHDLDDSVADVLLSVYAGSSAPEFRERLLSMLRLYDALQWLWLACRQLLNPDASQERRLSTLGERIL